MRTEPLFSVVIPTRDQRARLDLTLESIAAAEIDPASIEVVAVDDGSSDGTYDAFRDRRYPFRFQIHRANNSNQSATTNEAIRHASGTYVLSSAQDILFDPHLLEEHLKWHRRFADENLVVLGYLPYARHLDVTPFMFYLVSGGYQFAYYLIRDPLNVPPNFLYAPNFSVKRELLLDAGCFDEQFPFGCQDTDLAIRLVERGARIVYNSDAVGYHNHPIDLAGFCRRQQIVGAGTLNLGHKHPHYEGGHAAQDLSLAQYALCSDSSLDRAEEAIHKLEAELERYGRSWQALWERAFCAATPMGAFSDEERMQIALVETLFKAYQLVLGYHWGKGYLNEAVRVDGKDEVERWVRARLSKSQASIQARRVAERRLGDSGLELELHSPRDYRASIVLHDVDDYDEALQLLEPFDQPSSARCNFQILLVAGNGTFSGDESDKLGTITELIRCSNTDEGILEALSRCEAECVLVTSAKVEPLYPHTQLLAEKLFARLPDLSILGGAIGGGDGGRRYGHRSSGEDVVADSGATPERPLPIEVAIPEFCWLRGAALRRLLDESPAGEDRPPWNFDICDRASRSGQLILHVPELEVRRRHDTARVAVRLQRDAS